MASEVPSTSTGTTACTVEDSGCIFKQCQGCSYTFSHFRHNEELLLRYFYSHGVLPCHSKCLSCGTVLEVKPTRHFRCQNLKKKSKRRCKTRVSIFKLSFFSNVHLTPLQVAEVVWLYITTPPPRYAFIHQMTGLSSKTLSEWFILIRDIFIDWVLNNSQRLGGEGVVVEIDEAKIDKRKSGQWMFGGFERETKKVCLVAVQDRTAETLLPVIREKIRAGTTIISDCWRSYDSLGAENYVHLTVNRLVTHFMDPDTSVHTQNIERILAEVRKNMPEFNCRKVHSEKGYLAESLFFTTFPDHGQRYHEFWKAVAQLYPGLPHP